MTSRIKTSLPSIEFTIAEGNYDGSRSIIDRVIIHTSVSSAQSAIAHFGTHGTNVSAHYIVDLDGTIYHGLEETFTAYHAGDYPMNQRSIGIEHADNGNYNKVRPDSLYTSSAKLVNDICNFYSIPIDRDHIKKHSEVSDQATACPDALLIDRIVSEALALNTPPPVISTPSGTVINWNQQTIIPLDPPYKNTELGAVNSMLKDKDRDLINANNNAILLTQQLSECQKFISHPPIPQAPTPPQNPTVPSNLPVTPQVDFWTALRAFFGIK